MSFQYSPNDLVSLAVNPQSRSQAEQYLSSTFGRIAPQASERTYTLRGMTSSDDNGTLINQTPYYTDQNISSWYGTGDWTAGREGRFAGTQAPTADFMAIMSGQGDEFSPGFQTTGYTVDLTPDFRDERGYGRYVGNYDAQGNLTGITFQSRNLSQGWLGDNMDVWGPLLVGGAAALGGGLFGGVGGAGTTAGTTAGTAASAPAFGTLGSGTFGLGGATSAASVPFGSLTGSAALGGAGLAGGVGTGLAGAAGAAATGAGMSSLLSNPNLWLTGAQVVGGLLGADASRDASNAQVQASQAAIDESRRQYDTTRADLAPWRQAGVGALGGLAGLLGLNGAQPVDVMKMDPGFQFAQEQGEQAINRAARARGGFDSGATLKDLLRFNEGLSSQRFNDVYNRFAGVAGTGQNATNTTAQFGAQNASNVGNLLTGAGNARAAGIVGGANAINQTIGGVTNLWQQNSLLDMLTRRA